MRFASARAAARPCCGGTTSARSTVGKRADIAVWRTDGLEFGGAEDLVANLVLSGPHRVDRLLVGGAEVVRGGALVHADEQEIAREQRIQAKRLWQDVTDLDPCARHRARPPGRRRARRALSGRTARSPAKARPTATVASARSAPGRRGAYRLVFHPPSPFFKRVELEVALDDGHLHVPLLISSYGCASYRGS